VAVQKRCTETRFPKNVTWPSTNVTAWIGGKRAGQRMPAVALIFSRPQPACCGPEREAIAQAEEWSQRTGWNPFDLTKAWPHGDSR